MALPFKKTQVQPLDANSEVPSLASISAPLTRRPPPPGHRAATASPRLPDISLSSRSHLDGATAPTSFLPLPLRREREDESKPNYSSHLRRLQPISPSKSRLGNWVLPRDLGSNVVWARKLDTVQEKSGQGRGSALLSSFFSWPESWTLAQEPGCRAANLLARQSILSGTGLGS
ncbi:hypothetical protein Cgig2_020743 [Carnegiea gigantea]|uniref:Uncharacterized protein n=1 Tax=Carnegiea gigantea TaxID=171969 RepID=A0A9Q1JWJ2_9CARY|nr:hypothetical protein Cgig2_020743 [Carnegiea gigantea]